MADAPFPITSPPDQPGQPWDAAGPDGVISMWNKLPGGAVGDDGQLTGDDFPSDGPWRQC